VVIAGTGYVAASAWPASTRAPEGASAREVARLERRLAATVPTGIYIVIDRTHNRFSLRRGEETVLDALCSAGSGARLVDPSRDREWVFATPRGRFEVLRKLRNPAWRRPDWSFIESGEPIPDDPGDRIEYGALGEFALDFGDGYLIHGTLYERLLGRSVSHGCIRLGRDDLREVYASTRIGTPIYIY
jgi:L,D-transpeptidase YbiS